LSIAIHNLTKRYGAQTAVDDLSCEVAEGSVYGLLGPNGAGKSTAFKCVLGLARPNAGSITIDGKPLAPATFEFLSFVPERPALYEWMTVRQHFELARRTYARFDTARAAELGAIFKLDSAKRVKRLSKGQHTAVALALAFSIRPRVMVLDEPASGLDPIFQRVVLDLIIDAAAGGAAILFSSHQIGQVERAADRIGILNNGKLVLEGDLDTLKGNQKVVEAVFDSEALAPNGLADDQRVARIVLSGRIMRVYVRRDAGGIVTALEALAPRSLSVFDLSLEDMFLGAVDDGSTGHGNGAA
jgi:ABC-2 type transport system ATP-binding protein